MWWWSTKSAAYRFWLQAGWVLKWTRLAAPLKYMWRLMRPSCKVLVAQFWPAHQSLWTRVQARKTHIDLLLSSRQSPPPSTHRHLRLPQSSARFPSPRAASLPLSPVPPARQRSLTSRCPTAENAAGNPRLGFSLGFFAPARRFASSAAVPQRPQLWWVLKHLRYGFWSRLVRRFG